MKIRHFMTIIILLMVSWAASAQRYNIRLTYNTNLRVANSLTSGIIESAPAGSILQVLGQQDRWLKIDRNGNQVWMAGWVRHSRVERSALTESPSQTPVDNCCFVDRLCNTDQEWTDGFWAFQTGQCAAPVQSLPQVQPQTQPGISSAIDNCCFVDRQCNTDREWTNGYWAFQKGFCTGVCKYIRTVRQRLSRAFCHRLRRKHGSQRNEKPECH